MSAWNGRNANRGLSRFGRSPSSGLSVGRTPASSANVGFASCVFRRQVRGVGSGEDDSLEITEVNDMGAWHSGSLPGGHGLRQFAAEIEHIGGSLSTDCENGIWMFHARIPFD